MTRYGAALAAALVGAGALALSIAWSWDYLRGYQSRVEWGSDQGAQAERSRPAGLSDAARAEFDLSNLQIPEEQILPGGPPKDGIPALTEPEMVPAAEAAFLDDGALVAGVTQDGDARAFPIAVLNHHEIVNTEVGGRPVAVVYCPLCDSVSVIDRRVGDETLEFGVSGLLYNSNVLMYDRTHDGLWSQILLKAVSGPHAGEVLVHLPWEYTTFGEWREKYPESTVMTFDTGHPRNYNVNPYARYFEHDDLMFDVAFEDDRLEKKAPVVGVAHGGGHIAYPVAAVASAPNGRLETRIDGEPLVLEARANGVAVTEAPDDAQTIHTFWFAWAATHPNTDLFDGSGEAADGSVASRAEDVQPLEQGAQAPAAVLRWPDGEEADLAEIYASGPTLVIFYRGGWCPYCTTHLAELAELEADLVDAGVRILAVSPDRPEALRASQEEFDLSYELLSDSAMALAKAFGVAFQVDSETVEQYKEFGIDLAAAAGESHHLLPVPAVYLVGPDGTIEFAFWDTDYTERLSGEALLAAVREHAAP